MRFLAVAIVISAASAFCAPAFALEIDARTDLMANCGASYILAANDKSIAKTKADAEQLRNLGTHLLNLVDETLKAQGMSLAAREKFGKNQVLEVSEGLKVDSDQLGFTPEECTALVEEMASQVEATNAAAADAKATAEAIKLLDQLLTCMSGFYFASNNLDDKSEAKNLIEASNMLATKADAVLTEAGWNLQARQQVGALYELRVREILSAGDELIYSWEGCSELAYE
jgi:hypothetical protein